MTQKGTLMNPVTNQVEFQKLDWIKKILSKYEDFIMTVENFKKPMNFEEANLSQGWRRAM
jgi:hypothetical protein